MLSIETFTFNPFQENTYVAYDGTGDAIIVDAGCYDRSEERELADFITTKKLTPRFLVQTHSHIDHILGAWFVKDKYKIPMLVHRMDESLLRAGKISASIYGMDRYTEVLPDGYLSEGEPLKFGNQSLDVIFVPGHAPGHIAFFHKEQKLLLIGDVLFNRSIGRTDLPGGDFQTLINSIHQRVFTLPDETIVFPGHGPTTTVGEEKRENPFCAL